MTERVTWEWSRIGAQTVITIRAQGLVFIARRSPFETSWSLDEILWNSGSARHFNKGTARRVKKHIFFCIGEKVAKEFAGVDR